MPFRNKVLGVYYPNVLEITILGLETNLTYLSVKNIQPILMLTSKTFPLFQRFQIKLSPLNYRKLPSILLPDFLSLYERP